MLWSVSKGTKSEFESCSATRSVLLYGGHTSKQVRSLCYENEWSHIDTHLVSYLDLLPTPEAWPMPFSQSYIGIHQCARQRLR